MQRAPSLRYCLFLALQKLFSFGRASSFVCAVCTSRPRPGRLPCHGHGGQAEQAFCGPSQRNMTARLDGHMMIVQLALEQAFPQPPVMPNAVTVYHTTRSSHIHTFGMRHVGICYTILVVGGLGPGLGG